MRQRIVLSMLLLHANHSVSIGRLIEAVWDGSPPPTAKGQIQICISAVRRALEASGLVDRIVTEPASYRIRTAEGELDLHTFNALLSDGRRAVREHRLAAAATAFRRAAALCQEPPLSCVESRLIEASAALLTERWLSAVEEGFRVELRLGRHHEIVDELTTLANEHPLREGLWRQLMTVLYRTGRRADALAAYQSARQVSVDRLGLEPSESLRLLEHAILKGDVMSDPDAVEQALPAFPMPRMTPADIAYFTGRAESVESLRGFLQGRDCVRDGGSVPAAAIAGRAGIGKTAIAVHLAHQLADHYCDGQLFAQLGGWSRPVAPAQVLERFLRALGVATSAIPDGLEARAATFRSCVAKRRVLVILDDAVDERQVQTLLPGSPECGVIVTSRRRLAGVPGSRLVDVGLLDRFDCWELLALMIGRDRVEAEPDETARLVEMCGRLPLALRIAATRLIARPYWRVAQLTERLADETRRLDELSHRGVGVRESISPSYHGVEPRAQRLLSRLSTLDAEEFPGWAAAPLLDLDVATATDILDKLVDAQLVDVVGGSGTDTRYCLHGLVRLYARERLDLDEGSDGRPRTLKQLRSA